MSDTLPWYGYLALGLLGLFVLLIVLVFLYAFLEGWWLSRQTVPTRRGQLASESDFDKSALPAIAGRLRMEQVDRIPERLRENILEAMPGDWSGAEFADVLMRRERDGVAVLCNVRRAEAVTAGDSSGEGRTKRWTETEPITISAFWQTAKPYLPEFSTRPFVSSLMVKLTQLFGRTWYGHPRFDDDPEFHEKLLVSAADPERVRPVLTERVRTLLKENPALTTSIRGRAVVVYAAGHPVRNMPGSIEDGDTLEHCKILAAEEWPALFEATRNLVTSLRQSLPSDEST